MSQVPITAGQRGAVIAALMLLLASLAQPAHATAQGSQNFPNSGIADAAWNDRGKQAQARDPRTGSTWDQPGQCIKWVQRWVAAAGGRLGGGGAVSSYRNAGAVEVSADQATRGDIFQISRGDSFEGSPHTGVLMAGRGGDGSFHIVEGNYDGQGRVREHRRALRIPAGHQLRFWRLGRVPSAQPPRAEQPRQENRRVGDRITTGQRINAGEFIESGGYRLHVQREDGNIVLYNRSGRAIWATNRPGAEFLALQQDGNLVAYGGGRAIWATNTVGSRAHLFAVQPDGNAVLYAPNRAVWATNTAGR